MRNYDFETLKKMFGAEKFTDKHINNKDDILCAITEAYGREKSRGSLV